MLIHPMPEHLFQSLADAMLDDQLLQSGNDDRPLFLSSPILDDDRSMFGILVVDDPFQGAIEQFIIRHMPPFQHFSDTLGAFCLLDGFSAIGFGYADFKQVSVGFHSSLILSPAFSLFQILTGACTELIFTKW